MGEQPTIKGHAQGCVVVHSRSVSLRQRVLDKLGLVGAGSVKWEL